MTRKQYLKIIENNIQSLTLDEQKEALNYYNDYFDDAGDDEKAMEELGKPEEVALKIIEKMANVPVSTTKEQSNNQEQNESFSEDSLCFSFNPKSVKNLDINIGAAEVVVVCGKEICIETRGISRDFFNCNIDSDSTLHIKNLKKLNFIRFFGHDNPSRLIPRILITIPKDFSVQNFNLTFGAGRFEAKNVSINFENANIDFGAGNLILSELNGKNASVRCSVGNFEFYGNLEKKINVDCGMGNMKFIMNQDLEKASCDVKVGLGSFKFNSFEKNGITRYVSEFKKENHFSVNVGLGSVIIKNK